VHNAVRCECDTCRYCYTCQDDEVKWSEDKLRTYMNDDSSIKLGEGDSYSGRMGKSFSQYTDAHTL
jgi:hypothetical protein